MKRIVLMPFIGRVLSHMIVLNGLFKDKPYCMCKTPMNEDMTPFRPLKPKIGALE
jgi:hypothetical protein